MAKFYSKPIWKKKGSEKRREESLKSKVSQKCFKLQIEKEKKVSKFCTKKARGSAKFRLKIIEEEFENCKNIGFTCGKISFINCK